MKDIAFLELPGGASDNVCPRTYRVGVEERKNILELVAKTERPAGLVETCSRHNARCEGLVQEPAVYHQIECSIRRAHLDRAQQSLPVVVELLDGVIDASRLPPFPGKLFCVPAITPLAEDEYDLRRILCTDLDMNLQCCARVRAGVNAAAKIPAQQRRQADQMAFAADEILPVRRKAVRWMARGQERHPLSEVRVPGIAGEQCAATRFVLANHVRVSDAPQRSQQPFGVIGGRDAPCSRPKVAEPKPCHFHRVIRRHEY